MSASLSEECFNEFLSLIHQLTGITVAKNRTSMLEGRLRKRLATLAITTYEEYLNLVCRDASEQTHFIDLVTTNETYFFRTPRIWTYLENQYIPNWFTNHPKQTLNVWSAAASSGEEAHSVAILCQNFKETHPEFNYQVTGTDISSDMVKLCQQGKYSGRSIEAFRKTRSLLFDKYMKSTDQQAFQVLPEIRQRLRFKPHNLFRPLIGSESFDLILARNVLIYFTGADQQKVLSLIAPRLKTTGILIIGESESLTHLATPFKAVEPLIYQAKDEPIIHTKAA